MDFAFPDLLSLVLHRLDCHPIAALDGLDVDTYEHSDVVSLMELGVLVQQEPLEELDGCFVQWLRDRPFLFDPDGDRLPEPLDPRVLINYEIDVLALCRGLRRDNGLGGPSIEQLSDAAYFIGRHESGTRRRSICLARGLNGENLMDTVWAAKGRLGTSDLVLFTPCVLEIQPATLRDLTNEGTHIFPLSENLTFTSHRTLTIETLSVNGPDFDARRSGRLHIDVGGNRATIDGTEISCGRMGFNLLTMFAREAADGQGFVPRDQLLSIIEANSAGVMDIAKPQDLDNALTRLRRALSAASEIAPSEMTALIETKRNIGHRLGLAKLELSPDDIMIS